jgi:hypothetical protein
MITTGSNNSCPLKKEDPESPVSSIHINGARRNNNEKRHLHYPPGRYLFMEKKLIGAFLYILLFPVLLFLLAGDWGWREGWVFSLWFLVLCYTVIMYLYRKDPGLLAERYRMPGTGN